MLVVQTPSRPAEAAHAALAMIGTPFSARKPPHEERTHGDTEHSDDEGAEEETHGDSDDEGDFLGLAGMIESVGREAVQCLGSLRAAQMPKQATQCLSNVQAAHPSVQLLGERCSPAVAQWTTRLTALLCPGVSSSAEAEPARGRRGAEELLDILPSPRFSMPRGAPDSGPTIRHPISRLGGLAGGGGGGTAGAAITGLSKGLPGGAGLSQSALADRSSSSSTATTTTTTVPRCATCGKIVLRSQLVFEGGKALHRQCAAAAAAKADEHSQPVTPPTSQAAPPPSIPAAAASSATAPTGSVAVSGSSQPAVYSPSEREAALKAARGAQPAARAPYLTQTHLAYTHPGGTKPLDATNQDTSFCVVIDEHNALFGVLDGHGAENGELVARVAAGAIEAYVLAHFGRLRTEPAAVFRAAFEAAHDACRRALLDADSGLVEIDGVPVEEWEDEEGELRHEAADGGTTATVVALIDGATLVHAQVGDSSAPLGWEP